MIRLLLLAGWAAAGGAAEPVDFPSASAEMLAHLRALVRLDTSNPPGNEILAAEYLRAALEKDGIASEILTSTGTRSSLVARLKGGGKKRPLLLMCHTDVVPVERGEWSVDPFGASIDGDYLYGRGTADVKSMCAAELTVLALLKRGGARLDRDVIFLAQADEESGGSGRHVDWLVERHFDKLDAEFGINEGGYTHWEGGRIAAVDLQCAEKQYLDLVFRARGRSGHASLPQPGNAVHALLRALSRLAQWEGGWEVSPLALAYLESTAKGSSPELRREISRLKGRRWKKAARRVARLSPELGALLRDSCAVTMLKAGYKSNVIPEEAEATANCRLLPGRSPERFVAELKARLKEPAVEIEYAPSSGPPAPAMPIDSELFRAVAAVAAESAPGAPVRPYMAAWSTDSMSFRQRGVKVYGLDPPMSADDNLRTHGKDERISISGLDAYLRLLYALVLRVAGAN